jgi:hypothetical protein
MNQLKKFYQDAESNKKMKDELVAANEKAGQMEPEKVKKEIIRIGEKFGYDITEDDFKELMGERKEGELEEGELEEVVGGAGGGCFLSNAGCTLFGEIDEGGGCILVGAYR